MKKQLNTLLGTFEKVARAMASRHDIRVVASSCCSTDGRTIYYPINADYLADSTKKALHGYLDHEVGHITEEDEHRAAGKRTPIGFLDIAKTNKERVMMNVIEDIRMERKKAQQFVGVAENLRESQLAAVKIIRSRMDSGKADFWYAIGCAIIQTAHGLTTEWLPEKYEPFFEAVKTEIPNISKAVWAEDSWKIVQNMLQKIADTAEDMVEDERKEAQAEPENSNEQRETGDEKGDSEGEDTKGGEDTEDSDKTEGDKTEGGEDTNETDEDEQECGEDTEGGEDTPDGEDSTEPTKECERGGGEDEDGEDSEDGEGDGGEDTEGGEEHTKGGEGDDKSDFNVSDKLREVLDEIDEDTDTDDIAKELGEEITKEAGAAMEADKTYHATPEALADDKWEYATKSPEGYEKAKSMVADQIKGMKGKLMNLIRAQSLGSIKIDQDEGELDIDALHLVPTGSRRVFQQATEGNQLDTAVSIMIDQSGSMGYGQAVGNAAYYARIMAVALAETFSALNVPFEIIGFHNSFSVPYGAGREYEMQFRHRESHMRATGLRFEIFKDFGEKYRKVKERLGTITGHGDNTDGEALMEVAKRLAVRPEKRKLLFAVSDGQPASQRTETRVLQQHLLEVVRQVSDAGIEVIGIGAGTRSVEEFYNDSTHSSNMVVSSFDNLASEVYKMMKTQMLKGNKANCRKRTA